MELVSTKVAAAHLDCHPETLVRHAKAGKIPSYHVGRSLKFDIEELRDAYRVR